MNVSRLQDLFDQAIALHQQDDLAGAERLYQQVLLMEPASFGPRHMLGVIRFQQGRNAEAIDLIAAALRQNPQVAAAWVNLGNVQAARAAERRAAYRGALAPSPGDAILNALAGVAWARDAGTRHWTHGPVADGAARHIARHRAATCCADETL